MAETCECWGVKFKRKERDWKRRRKEDNKEKKEEKKKKEKKWRGGAKGEQDLKRGVG